MNPAPLPTSCARVQGRLEALADRGLPALEEARDRGHLEACHSCRREHEAHLALLAALRSTAPADIGLDSARVANEVLARCPELRPVRGSPRVPLVLVAAAAAMLVLFLLGTRAPDLVEAQGERQLAALEGVLEHLPSWADIVRGLENLSRGLS